MHMKWVGGKEESVKASQVAPSSLEWDFFLPFLIHCITVWLSYYANGPEENFKAL